MEREIEDPVILRLKGIKKVISKGRAYHYERRTMTRLPGLPGSAEFVAKLVELQKKQPQPVVTEPPPPNTLGGLFARYRASPEFTQLAAGSRRQYMERMNRLHVFDKVPLDVITTKRLFALRDKLFEKYSRSAANGAISMLRLVFEWGLKRELCPANPASRVDNIRRSKDAPIVNRRWTRAELETVLAEAPPWMKVGVAIAAYTGMRQSDVVRVTWSAYNGDIFEARQYKTGRPIWVPVHRDLRLILEGVPRLAPQIVVGVRGRPMSENSFGSRFFDFMKVLRDRGLIGEGLSFHGLRHTFATLLAETGCGMETIAALLGHASPRMSEAYAKTADRRGFVRDAIKRLESADG